MTVIDGYSAALDCPILSSRFCYGTDFRYVVDKDSAKNFAKNFGSTGLLTE